jgi:hypothetical protein
MANDFYTPGEAARVLASLVNEDALLSGLVSRNFENDLMAGGKGGAPVALSIPTTLVARSRAIDDVTNSILMDEIAETYHTINLNRAHDYSAVPLSEKDLTLELQDFSKQVLAPQAAALVDLLEHRVATALQGVEETTSVAYDPNDPVRTFTAIRKILRDNGVSASGLNVAVGTEVYAQLLDSKVLTDASQSGSTAALREANVGQVRGFTIVENTRLDEDEIIAFHRDAVTLVTRAPVVPQGASFGATVNEKGFSLRYMRDYLAEKTVDRSFVSTFSGVAILPTYKIERTYNDGAPVNGQSKGGTATVTEIENGGIVRVKTSTVAP